MQFYIRVVTRKALVLETDSALKSCSVYERMELQIEVDSTKSRVQLRGNVQSFSLQRHWEWCLTEQVQTKMLLETLTGLLYLSDRRHYGRHMSWTPFCKVEDLVYERMKMTGCERS